MAKKKEFSVYPIATSVTVLATGTTSSEVDLTNYNFIGIFVPSTFDGTTITFTASDASGGTFLAVAASNAASTAYTVTTTASIYTPIDIAVFRGLKYIKLVCGSTQNTTDTIFKLALVPRQI